MTYTSDVLDEEYKITFNDEREHSWGRARAIRDRRPALPPVLRLLFTPVWAALSSRTEPVMVSTPLVMEIIDFRVVNRCQEVTKPAKTGRIAWKRFLSQKWW